MRALPSVVALGRGVRVPTIPAETASDGDFCLRSIDVCKVVAAVADEVFAAFGDGPARRRWRRTIPWIGAVSCTLSLRAIGSVRER